MEKQLCVAEKFLKAIIKAYKFIEENEAETVAEALLPSFDGNTISELAVAVEHYMSIGAWSENMVLTEQSFTNLMNVMLNAEEITETSPWSSIVDNSLAEKLAA